VSEASFQAENQSPERTFQERTIAFFDVSLRVFSSGRLLRDYPAHDTAPGVPHRQLSVANAPVCSLQYSGE